MMHGRGDPSHRNPLHLYKFYNRLYIALAIYKMWSEGSGTF